jgi:uracil-DNA glycosylase family 4
MTHLVTSMTKHAEHMKHVAAYAANRGASTKGIRPYIGNPQASVMIVGRTMPYGDVAPFDSPPSKIVRQTLAIMEVTPPMVLMTNLVKFWFPVDGEVVADEWRTLLMEEMAIVAPKAVILLGTHVANQIVHQSEDIGELRKHRFGLKSLPRTTFFVTHDPSTLVANAPRANLDPSLEFMRDLRAVFDVDRSYFAGPSKLVTDRGEPCPEPQQ